MSIKAITFEPVAVYRKPAYGKAGYGFRLTNLDEVNPVYFETDNLTVTSSASSPLPQQASVTFDGTKDVWMSSGVLGRIVLVDFSPSSLTYDNPVGVQIALNALGLATAANQVGGGQLAQPAVPNMLFATSPTITSGNIIVLPAPGSAYRLWAAWLSYSVASSSSYTGGLLDFVATLADPPGNDILAIELTLGGPSQLANDTIALSFPGIPFPGADAIQISLSGAVAGVLQDGAAGVMYSIP